MSMLECAGPGPEEAIRRVPRELALETSVVERAGALSEIDAPTLADIRDDSWLSQAVFAPLLDVSSTTEQG
jgi:DNA-binding transcriptional regulator YiaG